MNITRFATIVLITLTFLFISACGGAAPVDTAPVPVISNQTTGDPEAGLLAFNDHCFECHSTQEGVAIAGPSLFSAGDKFSYDYVKQSILDPHAIVIYVENPQFADKEMPEEIVAELSEQNLEDIIAYVLSQVEAAGITVEN